MENFEIEKRIHTAFQANQIKKNCDKKPLPLHPLPLLQIEMPLLRLQFARA